MRIEEEISYTDQIEIASEYLSTRYPEKPQIGIILGTGLGQLIKHMEVLMEIPYDLIPHFPLSTVESHHGKLIFGKLAGKAVVAMQGRFHYYEGYSMKQVTFPVRVLKKLGISYLFVSNAAGGLHPDFEIGDLMIIRDHIDLLPENPLRGKNLDQFGVRFPDMSEPYDMSLVERALEITQKNGIRAISGVYVAVQGPNLETKAEYRFLRTIGADAVGMSTVPEVIVARHMNLPVFAVSAITDLCSPGKVKKVSLAEVLAGAAKAEPGMSKLIFELIKGL
jgi:purine-nucleoside phosphorylase